MVEVHSIRKATATGKKLKQLKIALNIDVSLAFFLSFERGRVSCR